MIIMPQVNPHRVGMSTPAATSLSVEPARFEQAGAAIAAFFETGFLTQRPGKAPGVAPTATPFYPRSDRNSLRAVNPERIEPGTPSAIRPTLNGN